MRILTLILSIFILSGCEFPETRQSPIKHETAEVIQCEHKNMLFDCLECGERVGYTRPAVPRISALEDVISKSDLWLSVGSRPKAQHDKRKLAQALHKMWGGV